MILYLMRTVMRSTGTATATLGFIFLLGCSVLQKQQGRDQPQQLNLSGVWEVTTGSGDQRTMILVQQGTKLTGEVEDGKIVGEVNDSSVKVWLENDPKTVGRGKVSGDGIEGDFTCEFEERSGGWRAVRSRVQGEGKH
jgi:hypothetical protein